MPLTEPEKQNVKRHLGYPLVNEGAALAAGRPISIQPMFIVASALEKLPEVACEYVRQYLGVMDNIFHLQATRGLKTLVADQLEDLKLREKYIPDLQREYRRWQERLSQVVHAPINAEFSGVGEVDGGTRNVTMG